MSGDAPMSESDAWENGDDWQVPQPTGSDPNDPDGQMNDQEMPTTDGQMASGISEEVIPPTVEPRNE